MKIRNYLFLLLTILFAVCNRSTAQERMNEDEELKQLVVDYGNAMNRMTQSTLAFGGDTETAWAIDTVNAIWTECQKKPFDVLQYLADIAVMEKYFAYGVDYLPLMLYTSKYFNAYQQGDCSYCNLFEDDRRMVDTFYVAVQANEEWIDYFLLHTFSLNLVILYHVYKDDLKGIETSVEMSSFNTIGDINSLYQSDIPNKEYYAWRLDGVAFFKTYAQWIGRTTDDPNNANRKLLDWAYWMDDKSKPILSALHGNGKMPDISEEEHIRILKQTLRMYVDIIGMLENNFKRISEG